MLKNNVKLMSCSRYAESIRAMFSICWKSMWRQYLVICTVFSWCMAQSTRYQFWSSQVLNTSLGDNFLRQITFHRPHNFTFYTQIIHETCLYVHSHKSIQCDSKCIVLLMLKTWNSHVLNTSFGDDFLRQITFHQPHILYINHSRAVLVCALT